MKKNSPPITRFLALWLILSLSLPNPAFALRAINAGQPEGAVDDQLTRALAGAEEVTDFPLGERNRPRLQWLREQIRQKTGADPFDLEQGGLLFSGDNKVWIDTAGLKITASARSIVDKGSPLTQITLKLKKPATWQHKPSDQWIVVRVMDLKEATDIAGVVNTVKLMDTSPSEEQLRLDWARGVSSRDAAKIVPVFLAIAAALAEEGVIPAPAAGAEEEIDLEKWDYRSAPSWDFGVGKRKGVARRLPSKKGLAIREAFVRRLNPSSTSSPSLSLPVLIGPRQILLLEIGFQENGVQVKASPDTAAPGQSAQEMFVPFPDSGFAAVGIGRDPQKSMQRNYPDGRVLTVFPDAKNADGKPSVSRIQIELRVGTEAERKVWLEDFSTHGSFIPEDTLDSLRGESEATLAFAADRVETSARNSLSILLKPQQKGSLDWFNAVKTLRELPYTDSGLVKELLKSVSALIRPSSVALPSAERHQQQLWKTALLVLQYQLGIKLDELRGKPPAAGVEESKAQITTPTDESFWDAFYDRLSDAQRSDIMSFLQRARERGKKVEITAVTGITDFHLHTDGGLATVAERVAERYPVEGIRFHTPGDLSQRAKTLDAFETPGLI